jgi:CubicO group peptidase (beta-lactamase class C family)
MSRPVLAFLAVCCVPSLVAQQRPVPPQLKGFDVVVERALTEFHVPGAAVAIVRNDSVVLAKGYGVRQVGEPARVDEHTMFAIGSASKAFTAAGIGMLVDEGKVRYDDPVTRYLPGFAMYDPYASKEMRIRDLLTHRSGLARGDLLWYGSSLNRDQVVDRVRFLKPSWSFRTTFGYQNLMFITAGQISARVEGKSWDDVMRDRLFVPLGMSSTNTTVRALAGQADVATPHALRNDSVRAIPYRNIDNAGPAGSINSNVVDMANWVRMQIDSGRFNGKAILSATPWAAPQTPQFVINDPLFRALMPLGSEFLTYGFGWFIQDFRGRKLVNHGGNIDGMSALIAMIPSERVGIVVLTNLNATQATMAIMADAFDRLLGVPAKDARDWVATVKKVADGLEQQGKEAEKKQLAARAANTRPSLDLAAYAGTYSDSLYGEATVQLVDGTLVAQYGQAFKGPLEHWHYDTFVAHWDSPVFAKSTVSFVLDADAKVKSMDMQGFGTFVRADKVDTKPAVQLSATQLEALAGNYALQAPPLTVRVEIMAGVLKLTVPGQPTYTLVAVTPTRFRLTGPEGMPPGFFADFSVPGKMTFEQPSPRPSLTFDRVK